MVNYAVLAIRCIGLPPTDDTANSLLAARACLNRYFRIFGVGVPLDELDAALEAAEMLADQNMMEATEASLRNRDGEPATLSQIAKNPFYRE